MSLPRGQMNESIMGRASLLTSLLSHDKADQALSFVESSGKCIIQDETFSSFGPVKHPIIHNSNLQPPTVKKRRQLKREFSPSAIECRCKNHQEPVLAPYL